MDGQSQKFGDDAVVIGGSGANARQCISAASYHVRFESMPEVRELAEFITKTPAQSEKSTVDSGSPIRVSKRSDIHQAEVKPRSARKAIAAAAAIILVAIAALGIYEVYRMKTIVDSVNYVESNLHFDDITALVSPSEPNFTVSHTDETKNILLCGCDIDHNGISRTDSMIILSIDHVHQKIKMTSLMRDMYLKIPGYGKNKLNAAFTFGGGDMLLETIYLNFGMRIDRYVCVDYAAFASVVDDLGGVEVEIEEMELEQFNKYVQGGKKNRITEAGRYNFNGQQALSYCRIRKVGTDTARTARQRKVLREIMRKCRSLSPVKAQHILSVVAPCVTTNMTHDEMSALLLEGLGSLNYDAMGLRIPIDGTWNDKKTGNAWYVEVNLKRNAGYLNQFIYGDDEAAQELVDQQQKTDEQKTEYNRSKYEKRKKKS